MLKEQVALVPEEFVAAQLTIVDPIEKVEPGRGWHTIVEFAQAAAIDCRAVKRPVCALNDFGGWGFAVAQIIRAKGMQNSVPCAILVEFEDGTVIVGAALGSCAIEGAVARLQQPGMGPDTVS